MNILKVSCLIIAFFSLCSVSCDREEPGLLIRNDLEFAGDGAGCGSIYVYKSNDDQNLLLEIQGNRADLEIDETLKEYEVTDTRLMVNILKFDGPIGNYACDDVANDQGTVTETWAAKSGKVFIQITEDTTPPNPEPWEVTFKVTVLLSNATFTDSVGTEYQLEEVLFNNVIVGWLPG